MLLMTVAETTPLRARNIGFPGMLVGNPSGFNITLGLQIVIQVRVDYALGISMFGADFLEIYGPAVGTYLCRYYLATDVTNRLCYTQCLHRSMPPARTNSI
jgi:hypothetical protein